MLPRVGWRNLVSRLKQVVLPAPFGPIRPWMLPRRTFRETPFTATNPRNSFVSPSVSRMDSVTRIVLPVAAAPGPSLRLGMAARRLGCKGGCGFQPVPIALSVAQAERERRVVRRDGIHA